MRYDRSGRARQPVRRRLFSPASLFAAGEQGVWYDPSDNSTLFQDAAGTTPVTAVEQPVGLMLDKSRGLVLGPELALQDTSTLTGWGVNAEAPATVTVSSSGIRVFSPGGQGASFVVLGLNPSKLYRFTFNAIKVFGSLEIRARSSSQISSSGTYSYAAYPQGAGSFTFARVGASTDFTISNISVRELPGNHASQTTATSRPVLSARVNQYLATEALSTQNVTTVATGYTLRFEGAGTVTLTGTAIGVYTAGTYSITCTAGTLTSTVLGSVTKADLRVSNVGVGLPAYQRVNTATDYDAGPTFPKYLRCDGIDDGMVTGTITPGTDKAQVFAGVRKLSDAADAILMEFSSDVNSNNGSFYATAPEGLRRYFSISRGDAPASLAQGARISSPIGSAPDTEVLSITHDIASALSAIRRNGVAGSSGTADKGGGNFNPYPLYLFRRGGTSLPFNGHFYGGIIRFGPTLTADQITKTETWVNGKTGAY